MTIITFFLKYELQSNKGVRNCAEYIDKYGNLTIETHNYIYKMSKHNGRMYKNSKKDDNNYYQLIYCSLDKGKIPKKTKKVVLNPITGVNIMV